MAKHKRYHQSTKQICLSTKWDFFVAEQKEGNYTTPFCSEKKMFLKKMMRSKLMVGCLCDCEKEITRLLRVFDSSWSDFC